MKKINKILLSVIALEIIVFSILLFYPQIFRLKIEVEISTDPHQITFYFNQPVFKDSFEKNFKIKPFIEGELVWQDHNRSVIFKPHFFVYDLEYFASVNNVRSIAFTTLPEKQIKFRIEPPLSANLAAISPHILPLSEKNIFVKPNGTIIGIPPAQIAEGKYIDIDISDQIMTTYMNGKIKGVYEVSTGRYSMPTPLGTFKVMTKELNHWSQTYKLYMPYSLQFYPGFFIHELPYWPSGYREGVYHLGQRVSHGCVRLGIGPAAQVYNFADLKTPIVIHQ